MRDSERVNPITYSRFKTSKKMNKPKTVLSRTIYSDSYIKVIHDTVSLNKHRWNQVYFDKIHKNSVIVIPVEEDGVYLIKQYRHPTRKFIWQFPAGTCEKDSLPLQIAKKELLEEAGITAHNLKKIGILYSEPGLSTDKTTVFVATKLTKSKNKLHLDHSEIGMKLKYVKFETFTTMIKKGDIFCGITLSAYLLYLLS